MALESITLLHWLYTIITSLFNVAAECIWSPAIASVVATVGNLDWIIIVKYWLCVDLQCIKFCVTIQVSTIVQYWLLLAILTQEALIQH